MLEPHRIDIKLVQLLKADPSQPALPQFGAPLPRNPLLARVGVVRRVKEYVGINEDGSGHALPHASGTGQCSEEKACVPAPFASPARSRLARSCVPSAVLPVAGKH